MSDHAQGLLPMKMDTDNFRRPSLHIDTPLRGVHVKASSAGIFESDDGVARRDGSIVGTVEKVQYCNLETGYYILRVRLDENDRLVSFLGVCEPVSVGDRVEATGEWERHAKHGLQLRSRFIRTLTPTTGKEIFAFLKKGGVKGVGEKSAEKLFSYFGERLADVMLSPTSLLASGITEKQAKEITKTWEERSTNTEIIAFLQSLNVGPITSGKIIKKYGDRAKQKIKENPYRISRDITGAGFKLADQMALAMGFGRENPKRIDAAIQFTMGQIGRDGHCASGRSGIIRRVRDLLCVKEGLINEGIVRMLDSGHLVEEENGGNQVIYDASVLKCEQELAEMIVSRIGQFDVGSDIDDQIMKAGRDVGIEQLHENQIAAVRLSLKSRISVVTGGPGSGKTSSLEVLMRMYETLFEGCRILLCAPTGRAASRMTETTGRPAKTLHRLLEWVPEKGGFQKNADNPVDADIVVVDEASMLDIWLARDFFRAVKPDAILVFVGDVDQLPSVGLGKVLCDMIDSGIVPVTRLTQIFRQGSGSMIASTAYDVNAGRLPEIGKPNKKTDMWAIWDEDAEDSLPRICRLVSEVAPSLGYDPLKDVQILTAGHKGELGTVNLNRTIQDIINPEDPELISAVIGEKRFRKGDRVIQTVNNYDLDVFNGDIGQIYSIVKDGRQFEMMVEFEESLVTYTGSTINELTLAYAISVHKSQGSEFPFVVFVPSTQHFTMLKRPLIYTALTRAKKLCVIAGSKKAAKIAVKDSGKDRITGLSKRICIENANRERQRL